jgi:hypothetical protein
MFTTFPDVYFSFFSIDPFKNWHVVVGDSYELVVDVFDKDNNKVKRRIFKIICLRYKIEKE